MIADSKNGQTRESGVKTRQYLNGDDHATLLIDRLAAAIVDDSLPLKEVERELRGTVADVAIRRRGLGKRETAHRCGVTEKSIENYLKEVRSNPKSPEREVARVLQDSMLTLEEIYEATRPALVAVRDFTLDDVKRSLQKLISTGEVLEYSGRKYRAVSRPAIRYPENLEAHRELVDEKARDLDYVILTQKEATADDVLRRRTQRYSRVVGDTNLVRVDFTVDVEPENLPEFYEKLSGEIAKLTMKYEKKATKTRVRLLLGMRAVATAILTASLILFGAWNTMGGEGDAVEAGDGGGGSSWELDGIVLRNVGDEPAASAEPSGPDREGGAAAGGGPPQEPAQSSLVRGDVDLNDRIDLTDAVILLRYLIGGESRLACTRAADIDRDDRITLTDAVGLVEFLYGSSNRGSDSSGAAASLEAVDLSEPSSLDCAATDPASEN